MDTAPRSWFKHSSDSLSEPDIKRVKQKFGKLQGYAMYYISLELMIKHGGYIKECDLDLFCEDYGLEANELSEFFRFCLDSEVFTLCDNGYTCDLAAFTINKRNYIKTIASEAGKKSAEARQADSDPKPKKPKPPPKKPKPKKDPAPEIPPETKKQIAELRGYVQNMIDEYPDSKNGKNDLTDAQYVRLLDKYGRDKLVEMQKVFFEWKLAKSEKVKTTDYGTLIRDTGWVSTQADENINANKSLAQDEPLKPGEWRHPFPKPDGWEDMGFMEQTSYLRDKRKAIIAEGGTL